MWCAARRRRGVGLAGPTPWAFWLAVAAASSLAQAHPTGEELAENARRKTLCSREANPGEPFDTVRLGAEESSLRVAWGDALAAVPIERLDPDFYRLAPPEPSIEGAEPAAGPDPFAGQLRLRRTLGEGDVRSVEYELFRGRIYRIRWELGDRFHVRIMDAIVRQAGDCYGPPQYDQTIEAKIASGESTHRRAGWSRGGHLLEIRQLNPLLGGPIFVTVTDVEASRAIIAARGTVAPEPERRREPWWQRSGDPQRLPSDRERDALVRDFAAVLSQTDF